MSGVSRNAPRLRSHPRRRLWSWGSPDEIFQPVDVVMAVDEFRRDSETLVQRNRRVDPADHIFLERAAQPHQAFVAALAVDDQLGDQAVVIRRHLIAVVERAVDANAEPARWMITGYPAGRRSEGIGVLGIDTALDRVAAQIDVRLPIAERHAGGDAQLLADNVDAADHFA